MPAPLTFQAVVMIAFSACSSATPKSPEVALPPTPHLELPVIQVVVAIGYQRDPDNFYVLWAGIVRVVDKK